MSRNHLEKQLCILADDLTGALDSGVQLTKRGRKTVILPEWQTADFSAGAEVIVIDTETRHVPAEEAYQTVYDLVKKALDQGFPCIYKKTDSALRGNIGAELTALLDASSSDHVDFIPAYPDTGRTTVDGILYVDGIPVADSVFARDPINPATESRIADIIHHESRVPVHSADSSAKKGILVYDAADNADLRRIAEKLKIAGSLRSTAGCAGFLEVFPLPEKVEREAWHKPNLPSKMVVLSGSLNDVTKKQFLSAAQQGAAVHSVSLKELMEDSFTAETARRMIAKVLFEEKEQDMILIDTFEDFNPVKDAAEVAGIIASRLGLLAYEIFRQCTDRTLMIIGGDTLKASIHKLGIRELMPETEIKPGVVLASYQQKDGRKYMITKSGGFGSANLLPCIHKWLKAEQKEERK